MAMIVRPRNAATAASLATKVLAAASGLLARGAVNKIRNKASDLALKGATNLYNRVMSDETTVTARARTRRRGRARNSPASIPSIIQDNPPMAIFSGAPRITFTVSGRAQKNVEMGDNGIRVVGTDLFPWRVNSDGVDAHKVWNDGVNPNGDNVYLEPSTVSPRLTQFMQMYTYYAFRRIRFVYTPVVGTNTGGAIALSISSDINSTQPTTTMQKVLQNQHSVITEVWRPAAVEITHTGTKVFTPYTSENYSSQDRYQFEADGCFSSVLAAATYGMIFIEYEVDFYSPVFTHSGFTLQQKAQESKKPSSGPINESRCGDFRDSALRINSDRKDELKSDPDPGIWNGNSSCNGTGHNFVSDPSYTGFERSVNGSGSNSNITGGYNGGANGTAKMNLADTLPLRTNLSGVPAPERSLGRLPPQ